MLRNAIFSSLFVIGCLVLAQPAVAQPPALTSSNGCDVYVAISGGIEFQPFGHAGTLYVQKVSSGQLVNLDLECVDFPTEPEAQPEGIQKSVSICNWRMQENGVKGTTRAEVRWFPDPENPGQAAYSFNAQIIRGTRYPAGITSGQGRVDLNEDTITLDSFTAVLCRELDS